MEKWQLVLSFLGTLGIGSGASLLISRIVTNISRSRQEKSIDNSNAIKSTIDNARELIDLGAYEIKTKKEITESAWDSVSRLEGIIEGLTNDLDKYRDRLETVNKELSEVKLELIKEKEEKQIVEIKLSKYKELVKEIISYAESECPEMHKAFMEHHSYLKLSEEDKVIK